MKHPRRTKFIVRAIVIAAGGILITLAGILCYLYSFAEPVQRLSYDLPFLLRSPISTSEAALVYLDDQSAKDLGQPFADKWSRTLHSKLLDRLTNDKARMVFFDIVFDEPSSEPTADAQLADAIQRQGKVVLGAALDVSEQAGALQERIEPPIKPLRKAAAGWGLLVFRPVDSDYGVRRIYPGTAEVPTAAQRAVELLGQQSGNDGRPRWINYYGPAGTFAAVSFVRAIEPEGVPPGFFKNRIVFVGGRSAVGYSGSRRDEFTTPYSRVVPYSHHTHQEFSPGLEIQATVLLNLLHREWLSRMDSVKELGMIILAGLFAGCFLAVLRPWLALLCAILGMVTLLALACSLVWNDRIWFNWLVPAGIQIPLGLAWSVGSQYVLEARRRKQLRRAFGYYLSPQMADQISNSDFDLSPGGKLVEVTVIFTDLENFTTLSENLDPADVSKLLTDYFSQTTRCILDNHGTIIKYIGDAVFAAWGAPLKEPAHAVRAAETACRLRSLTEMEVRGIKLRTRIGIHGGRVLAGNLGSAYRFDYTMIGDAVNLASRLESLNKHLQTQVLISDTVRQQLGDKFVTRDLGRFRVAGRSQSIVVHELYCPRTNGGSEWNWIQSFEEGLKRLREGDLSTAREAMEQIVAKRSGRDGPAEFYLRKIAALEADGSGAWDGIVDLSEK